MGEITMRSRTTGRKSKAAAATSHSPPTSHHPRAGESAAYLAAIVESADDAIISKTLDGIVTSWNASAERMFGYTAQEMIGQPILHIIPAERQSEEGLILTRLRAGERIDHFETVRLRKDGRLLDVSLTISPVRDGTGAIIGASKIARDISGQRRLEREADIRAARLDAAFDALTDGFFLFDAAGHMTRMNDAARSILALDAAPEYNSLTPAERAARLNARDANDQPLKPKERGLTKLLQGERLADPIEFRITALDGITKDLESTGAPVRDRGGNVVGAVALLRDVTERRQLRQQTRRQASMLERTHDAIFIWELDGPILYWNHGAEFLYGYSKEQAVGQISHQLLQTERPVSPEVFRESLERTGEWVGEIAHVTRDGRRLIVESRHQLYVEADGKLYVLETCRDITERLKLEDALHRSHDELEQRVRERTRELASANRSLRQLSRQVLEAQEKERRRIARELHDEIGQALTGVKILLETAQRKAETNGMADIERIFPLPSVREAIDSALTRVREVSLDLRPAMLDSFGLLPTLLWHFETYAAQTGIQVDFHHTGLEQRRFAPEIETGAYRIVQEALTNVARYAHVPTVRIQIDMTDEALHLSVLDEGTGFDADDAIASGLSTGLAGMRERATLLGGVFLVSSAPGTGTMIKVELPRTASNASPIDAESKGRWAPKWIDDKGLRW